MPIKIPDRLPAAQTLRQENIFVMTECRASMQDIRPLQIGILNLMPKKIVTETQLVRLLGNTPLQVELTLISLDSHASRHTAQEHMASFYKTFSQVEQEKFDGLVITGAPIELLDYEAVDYWPELCRIMDWSVTNVYSTLHICWGALAGLYYHHGIPKRMLSEKLFGVYAHQVERKGSILFRGFDDVFFVPHSRHATIDRLDVERCSDLKILASSLRAGIYAVATEQGRQIFLLGHSEYDWDSLQNEYIRDKQAGLPIRPPENYYPEEDDKQHPIVSWRSCANLLFSNWLNYFVYQETPYDIQKIHGEENRTTKDGS